MKKLYLMLATICLAVLLAACGGGTSAPETSAKKETEEKKEEKDEKKDSDKEEKKKETKAEEETEAEEEEEEEEAAAPEMNEERFIAYFDMFLEENEINKSDFFLEYNGKKYTYDDLGTLFEETKKADGSIDVLLMGEAEETLDLEIMSEYLAFMEDWNTDSSESGTGLGNIPQEFIDRFFGDWHGMLGFRDCTGKYAAQLGDSDVTAIARFVIDSDGWVVPFIGVHVEDTPIMALEAELAPEDDCMYLTGEWIDVPFDHIPMTEKDGTLHAEIPISKEAGSLTMVFNFRHLNDVDWKNENPALPQDYITHCQGWSFEQLAESNGYTSWDYPEYSDGEAPEYPVMIAQEEEKEDFGKTTENATGVISKKALQSGYNSLMAEMDKSGHDPITYEKVKAWFGADGVKYRASQWTAEKHRYEWMTDGEKDWVDIIFVVNADGSETVNTVNQSEDILAGNK